MDESLLLETVKNDIVMWNKLHNKNAMLLSYMRLEKNGQLYYDLYLNEGVLWYGTLREINAVVKSMIIRIQNNDFL